MKKVLLNWRFWFVMIILGIAIVLFFCEPCEHNEHFVELLVASKVLAGVLFFSGTKLLQYYDKTKKIDFEEWDEYYEEHK